MKFWNFIGDEELRIDGDIVDNEDIWLYEWFGDPAVSPNNFRAELDKRKGKPLTVVIDSYGGSVFAAAGIYNALRAHGSKITVKIDGKAMSAASVVAMAGDEVLMSPVSVMMIHNPLTSIRDAYAADLRRVADTLDEVKETIINAYQRHSKLGREEISELMDSEALMRATTAIERGFATGTYGDAEKQPEISMANSRAAYISNTADAVKRIAAAYKRTDTNREQAIARARAILTLNNYYTEVEI